VEKVTWPNVVSMFERKVPKPELGFWLTVTALR